jgi:serine/threonine-protein kinase
VLEELGHGASGTVYLVRHQRLNTLRAVKSFKKDLSMGYYQNEVNLLKNLRHPGIPIIYDVEEDDERVYVVEEYIDGETLASRVGDGGKLKESEACAIALQLCEVLCYLHNRKEGAIVHLDLKPENVMLGRDGRVILLDYDSAALANHSRNACVGTAGYAAPEQYHRLKTAQESDIYALGMLIMFMLTGGHGNSGIERIKSRQLAKIIKKCIHHSPLLRFRGVAQVKAALECISSKITGEAHISLQVNLIGMRPGIGTTHIALAITKYLSLKGLTCAYFDRSGNESARALARLGKLGDSGAFSIFGIQLIPDYNGCVRLEDLWDVHVCDWGGRKNLMEAGISHMVDSPKERNVYVLVGCAKPWEEEAFVEAAVSFEAWTVREGVIGDTLCILNHMDGRQFYGLTRRIADEGHWGASVQSGLYRMPCQYRWDAVDDGLAQVFDAMFRDLGVEVGAGNGIRALPGELCDNVKGIFRKNNRRQ